jgi:hypothetical protein
MDLPFFKRGLELVSSQLNKLSSAIRSSTITSVIGGTLMRTPGGTTLVIDQQPGGGGGTAAAADYCFFKVTDASTSTQLRIQVQSDQVEGRWPDGMDGVADFIRNVPAEYANGGWFAVYVLLKVNESGMIMSAQDSISIQFKSDFQKEGSSLQWFYVAGVTVSLDPENKAYISRIDNSCPVVYAWPPSPCPFQVEDATDVAGTPQILVRTGKVNGVYPSGMVEGEHFIIAIPPSVGDWCAVYAKTQFADNDVTIEISTNYETSTSTEQYDLLSEVNLDFDGGTKYISYINNKCKEPTISAEAMGEYCPFKLTDVSTYNQDGNPTDCKINVQVDAIDGRYPYGMAEGVNYVLTLTSESVNAAGVGYIYLKIIVDEYGVPLPYSTAISIEVSSRFLATGSCIQRHLIGKFEMNKTNGTIIPQKIANMCPIPTLGLLNSCPFEVEDATEDINDGMSVLIRTGFVNGDRYPQGMAYQNQYILQIPGGQGDWRGVYMVLALNEFGEIDDGSESITFGVFNEIQESTSTLKNVLIADVYTERTAGNVEFISNIKNYCVEPKGNERPFLINSVNCDFMITQASSNDDPYTYNRFEIRKSAVNGRIPADMAELQTPYYFWAYSTTYVYLAVKYNTQTMLIVEDVEGPAGEKGMWITTETSMMGNTGNTLYILLGYVLLNESHQILYIENYCHEIDPNPCNLNWSDANAN